jgi:hypothetical protein
MSADGHRWVCALHWTALSEQWPRVTEVLLSPEAERVRAALAELRRVSVADWCKGQWQPFAALFADWPDLQPTEHERQRPAWWKYRLRGWLEHWALGTKPPQPRVPLEQIGTCNRAMAGIDWQAAAALRTPL